MSLLVPILAAVFGFSNDPGGTHTSRTMMLAELRKLLASCPANCTYAQYTAAIVDDNVLLKSTDTTRRRSLRGLRELYALDAAIVLFRALRELWSDDMEAQPLIALLCAAARDPVLRSTAPLILATAKGVLVTAEMVATAVDEHNLGRYNRATLAKIGRNVASTWQQAGHLQGHLRKVRAQADSRPAALAYALLLGHLCGDRGEALFRTLWAQILDAPEHLLRAQAVAAARQGWIDYRRAGNVTEISFRYLLREEGEGRANE